MTTTMTRIPAIDRLEATFNRLTLEFARALQQAVSDYHESPQTPADAATLEIRVLALAADLAEPLGTAPHEIKLAPVADDEPEDDEANHTQHIPDTRGENHWSL